MCWRNRGNIKKRVFSKQDLPCIKLVLRRQQPPMKTWNKKNGIGITEPEERFRSYYRDFEYVIGKTYSREKVVMWNNEGSNYVEISHAFHSYKTNVKIHHFPNLVLNDIVVLDKKNKSLDDFPDLEEMVILECTIPKGSECYVNKHGEIASNAIRVDGWRPIPKESKLKKIWNLILYHMLNF